LECTIDSDIRVPSKPGCVPKAPSRFPKASSSGNNDGLPIEHLSFVVGRPQSIQTAQRRHHSLRKGSLRRGSSAFRVVKHLDCTTWI